jgi:hypothetical protein
MSLRFDPLRFLRKIVHRSMRKHPDDIQINTPIRSLRWFDEDSRTTTPMLFFGQKRDSDFVEIPVRAARVGR